MDKDEKKAYGDTLLNSLKAMGNYNDNLATVTLAESAEQLKERLDAIMKFKKASKNTVIVMLVLTLVLAVGATAIGAYAATPTPVSNNSSSNLNVNNAAPSSAATSVSALQDMTADNAKSISITAKNCGIELVKSESNQFTFDYLGVENPSGFKVNANTKGSHLEISADGTVARRKSEHYYVDHGENPVNIVRIGIPDRGYHNLNLTLNEAPVTLSDFKAKVDIQSENGTVSISDKHISKGSYKINNASGGVSINANTVSSNMSIKNQGKCELIFYQMPQNLYLDLSNCQGQIVLPDGWRKTQALGSGMPIISISNDGYTEAKVDETQKTVLEMEMDANYDSSDPFVNATLQNCRHPPFFLL